MLHGGVMRIAVFVFVLFLLMVGGLYVSWQERVPNRLEHTRTEIPKSEQIEPVEIKGKRIEKMQVQPVPTKEKVYSPPRKTVTPSPEKPPSNLDLDRMIWVRTPEAQGLKVGDWVKVKGWMGTFVGASLDVQANVLRYNSDKGRVFISPMQNGGHSTSHRIIGVIVTVQNPYQDSDVKYLNDVLLREKSRSHWGARVQVLVTAKISQINKEPDYPDKWSIFCFGTSARVQHYPFSN